MASTYLSRTFTSAGNRKTFTISYWVKMGYVSTTADGAIFDAGADGSNSDDLYIHTGRLNFSGYYGSTQYQVRTSAKYRDLSGWYHHVVRFDTTQATASDRLRLYVNGELQTALDDNTYPSQNFETTYMNTARKHTIGSLAFNEPSMAFNGSMAHFHFCDGQSYDADTFGETDATTGIWKPKTAPSVTYGTNGFFLKFASAGSLGTDSSGNGNNFTLSGSGTQTQDTPSNVFATINPLNSSETSSTYFFTSLGNTELTATDNDSTRQMGITLNPENMKGYFEMKVAADNNWQIHVQDITRRLTKTPYDNSSNPTYRYTNAGSISYGTGTWTNLIASYTGASSTGDIVGVAFDFTGSNKNVWFHLNGTYGNNGSGVGNPATGDYPALTASNLNTADHYAFLFSVNTGGSDSSVQANFGNGYFGTTAVSSAQSPSDGIGLFEYSVPSGYKALCTKSINAQEYS